MFVWDEMRWERQSSHHAPPAFVLTHLYGSADWQLWRVAHGLGLFRTSAAPPMGVARSAAMRAGECSAWRGSQTLLSIPFIRLHSALHAAQADIKMTAPAGNSAAEIMKSRLSQNFPANPRSSGRHSSDPASLPLPQNSDVNLPFSRPSAFTPTPTAPYCHPV